MLNSDGTVKLWTPFITGFLQDNSYIGRPVDMLQLPDDSLLISDDWNGAVYRLIYSDTHALQMLRKASDEAAQITLCRCCQLITGVQLRNFTHSSLLSICRAGQP